MRDLEGHAYNGESFCAWWGRCTRICAESLTSTVNSRMVSHGSFPADRADLKSEGGRFDFVQISEGRAPIGPRSSNHACGGWSAAGIASVRAGGLTLLKRLAKPTLESVITVKCFLTPYLANNGDLSGYECDSDTFKGEEASWGGAETDDGDDKDLDLSDAGLTSFAPGKGELDGFAPGARIDLRGNGLTVADIDLSDATGTFSTSSDSADDANNVDLHALRRER